MSGMDTQEWLVLLYLALGFALAAIVTRWFNWLAWGQRKRAKMKAQAMRRARLKDAAGKGADDESGNRKRP